MNIRIVPLRQDFLARARQQGLDDQHQPVERLVAEGGEPCRDVLRRAKPGERLILASYCPFSRSGPYREYGPVFVLADPSAENVPLDRLPLPTGAETDYLGAQFVLRAYDDQERIVAATLSTPESCALDLERLQRQARPAFVLVRFAAYGCYALRLKGVH